MNGTDVNSKQGTIYFSNAKSGWTVQNLYLIIGNDHYIKAYLMSEISGSSFYKFTLNDTSGLADSRYYAFVNTSSALNSVYTNGIEWKYYINDLLAESNIVNHSLVCDSECCSFDSVSNIYTFGTTRSGDERELVGEYINPDVFTISNGTLTAYSGSYRNVVIPDTVTAIGTNSDTASTGAFHHKTALNSIYIPDTVTSIGKYAFYGCSSMVCFKFGEDSQLSSIGQYALSYCEYLDSIEIPSGVTSLNRGVCSSNKWLKTVKLPSTLTSIEYFAFGSCQNLSNINIPSGVTSIGSQAFNGCRSLKNIDLPSGITRIESYVFQECKALQSIEIPSGVTSIGYNAFFGCYGLTGVTIPATVASIDQYAFRSCSNLAEIIILNPSPMTIGAYAFYNCPKLTSITICNKTVDLTSCDISGGSGVTIYGYSGSSAQTFAESNGNTFVPFSSDSDFTYTTSDGETTITGYTGAGGAVVIPPLLGGCPVTAIGKVTDNYETGVFHDNTDITSVIIPSGVTSIGHSAFLGCTSLESATIPASITAFGTNAFYRCTSLTAINVDSNNNVFKSEDGVVYNKLGTEIVQYPGGKSGAFTIPSGITSIGERAFSYCVNLTNIDIPSSVKSLGIYAFCLCKGLKSVEIPASVTNIPRGAFYNCDVLESVTFGEGSELTAIGESAFDCCKSLESITIPSGVTSIAEYAFFTCTSLESADIPSSVTSIGHHAFQKCSSLGSIDIPSGLTSIEAQVFDSCTSLTSVTIPSSVTSIGIYAFKGCTNLEEAIILRKPSTTFSTGVFDSCKRGFVIYAYTTNTGAWSYNNGVDTRPLSDYTVNYTYRDYKGLDNIITRSVEQSKLSDGSLVATLVNPSARLKDPMFNYSIGTVEKNDTTISAVLNMSPHKFTVTFNGRDYGEYSYLDEVTIDSPDNETTGFLIDGNPVKYGKSFSFYVTDDMDITTDDSAVRENKASLNLTGTYINDQRLSLELLATANTDGFRRMGVAYALSAKDNEALTEAIENISGNNKAYNKIGVHFSNVDNPNISGQYQFRYGPYMSINNVPDDKTLYFYTFVETDDGILFSEAIPVAVSNLIA